MKRWRRVWRRRALRRAFPQLAPALAREDTEVLFVAIPVSKDLLRESANACDFVGREALEMARKITWVRATQLGNSDPDAVRSATL